MCVMAMVILTKVRFIVMKILTNVKGMVIIFFFTNVRVTMMKTVTNVRGERYGTYNPS